MNLSSQFHIQRVDGRAEHKEEKFTIIIDEPVFRIQSGIGSQIERSRVRSGCSVRGNAVQDNVVSSPAVATRLKGLPVV